MENKNQLEQKAIKTKKKIIEETVVTQNKTTDNKTLEDKLSQLLEKLEYQSFDTRENKINFYPFWGELALDRQDNICFILISEATKLL